MEEICEQFRFCHMCTVLAHQLLHFKTTANMRGLIAEIELVHAKT